MQVRTSANANESVNIRTVYDGLGRIDFVKTPVQQTFHAYDPNGKLVSQVRAVRHNYPTPTDDWAFEET